MTLRRWLMPCILALTLAVPMARAQDESACENQQSFTSCGRAVHAMLHWLHLDTLCAYAEEEEVAAPFTGQEEQACDPEVLHPQARLQIQVLVAPCPWDQLGQFQIFRMIRPGQCHLAPHHAAPIPDQV